MITSSRGGGLLKGPAGESGYSGTIYRPLSALADACLHGICISNAARRALWALLGWWPVSSERRRPSPWLRACGRAPPPIRDPTTGGSGSPGFDSWPTGHGRREPACERAVLRGPTLTASDTTTAAFLSATAGERYSERHPGGERYREHSRLRRPLWIILPWGGSRPPCPIGVWGTPHFASIPASPYTIHLSGPLSQATCWRRCWRCWCNSTQSGHDSDHRDSISCRSWLCLHGPSSGWEGGRGAEPRRRGGQARTRTLYEQEKMAKCNGGGKRTWHIRGQKHPDR